MKAKTLTPYLACKSSLKDTLLLLFRVGIVFESLLKKKKMEWKRRLVMVAHSSVSQVQRRRDLKAEKANTSETLTVDRVMNT